MFQLVNIYAVLVASVAVFLFGWLWYSPFLFQKPWMESLGKSADSQKITQKDLLKMMSFGFLITVITSYSIAVILTILQPENLINALEISIFLCFAFVITTKFTEMIYESKDPNWSKKPQLLFLISSGYHLGNFIIVTDIIWFFMNGMQF